MGIFDAFNNATRSDNNASPFGEAGLLGDPLHYLIGDKYDNFMRKTWEYPNEYAGKALTKFDTFDRKINPIHRAIDRTEIGGKIKDMVHNKPGDSALAVLGTIFGGGALMGGGAAGGAGSGGAIAGGGGGGGGAAGGGAALAGDGAVGFGGVGTAGIPANISADFAGASYGGGAQGALAASHGIGGGAGIGSATSGGGFLGSLQQNPQQYLQMIQQSGMGGGQQQQQQPHQLQPVVIKGRVWWI